MFSANFTVFYLADLSIKTTIIKVSYFILLLFFNYFLKGGPDLIWFVSLWSFIIFLNENSPGSKLGFLSNIYACFSTFHFLLDICAAIFHKSNATTGKVFITVWNHIRPWHQSRKLLWTLGVIFKDTEGKTFQYRLFR